MNWNQQIGIRGEALAVEFLHAHGFTIIEQNWRSGRSEVDIIVHRKQELHFIEVKTSTSDTFGLPEERITPAKFQALARASEKFLELNPSFTEVTFDILSVILLKAQVPEFYLIEDVRIGDL